MIKGYKDRQDGTWSTCLLPETGSIIFVLKFSKLASNMLQIIIALQCLILESNETIMEF